MDTPNLEVNYLSKRKTVMIRSSDARGFIPPPLFAQRKELVPNKKKKKNRKNANRQMFEGVFGASARRLPIDT